MSMQEPTSFEQRSGITMLGEWGGVVEYGSQKNQFATFYFRSVEIPARSRELGRRFCEDQVFVRIAPPGERLNIVDRRATDEDKQRYALQWAQFQRNALQVPDGTPIDLLFPASPAAADMLKASGVHTIEQCAELSGNAIDNIMGGQDYVNKAKAYLDAATKGVAYHKLQKELSDRDSKIRVLENMVNTLRGEVEKLQNQANPNLLDQVQALLAGGAQRPVFPLQGNLDKAFDAQTAQINANSPTAEVARSSRRRK